ncbi:MAG: tRNA uridine-5-carboxymethylaminomethyl(34) synthesis GTPase MnmE, partial [Acidimicrobiia bacterium]|nr:tRNA uridine-5-carboxymethylaminomethyl(34) synthesis GTPase MnmE [Acidimicrobiia bacterium]
MRLQDTIVAVSTPPGRGGLGVIRISGTEALRITAEMLEAPALTPRTATLATLTDDHGNAIDQVVVTYFQAPRSYTAEDVVEISCHGAPVILRHGVERACSAGARIAEPGEFTL